MTATDFLLITLSAAALHRIWNYEEVCATARAWTDKVPHIRKPALCPACNAFWFGLVAAVLWMFAHPFILLGLSAYAATRVMVWGWPVADVWTKKTNMKREPNNQNQTKAAPAPAPVPVATPKVWDRTVVVLTALNDFRPSYSLSACVLGQVKAIAIGNPTWQVQLWINQKAQQAGGEGMPDNVLIRPIVPVVPWRDGTANAGITEVLHAFLIREMSRLSKTTTIITHDLLFVSWYIPFAEAIHKFAPQNNLLWFHIPHSLPGLRTKQHPAITTLPAGRHYIAPVAKGSESAFANYYDTTIDHIIRVPNVFDPRLWGNVSDRVRRIVTSTRLMSYNFVQIFPACSTRLDAKGFPALARVFSTLNKKSTAFLLVCNPNASDALITRAKTQATEVGLPEDRLAFTSEIVKDSTPYGLDEAEIKTLMQDYGNIFVFPSISEADSKVCLEARLCRQYIITNADVPTLEEHADVLVPFGTSPTTNTPACEYAANRIIELGDKIRIRRHSGRDLEGIGDLWRKAINDARL